MVSFVVRIRVRIGFWVCVEIRVIFGISLRVRFGFHANVELGLDA